jgi:Protein of unknown function (DUF4232)
VRRTVRASRNFAAGVGVAVAAVLLPAAALASSGSSPVPRVGACRAASTEVWLGLPGNGAAGTILYEIQISNIGHSKCTFFGYPGVSELNIHGSEVGKPASHSGAKSLVTVQPGGTAHFVLTYHQAGAACLHPAGGAVLRVFPPGQVHSQLVELALQQCPGKSIMSVDAVHPGVGIPFFSLH